MNVSHIIQPFLGYSHLEHQQKLSICKQFIEIHYKIYPNYLCRIYLFFLNFKLTIEELATDRKRKTGGFVSFNSPSFIRKIASS